jgi:hypothetical protein
LTDREEERLPTRIGAKAEYLLRAIRAIGAVLLRDHDDRLARRQVIAKQAPRRRSVLGGAGQRARVDHDHVRRLSKRARETLDAQARMTGEMGTRAVDGLEARLLEPAAEAFALAFIRLDE